MTQKRGQWETLSSEIVHKNKFYAVRQDAVIKPDGSEGTYHVIESNDAVFIVALDEQQCVYLIGLHRYTIDLYSIEVPAGSTDGEDPLVAAQRELREEAGLAASDWKKLGITYPANGLMSEKNHIFLATGLGEIDGNEQIEEGITKVLRIPFSEALAMVKNGEITDTQTIAPLAMAALELGLFAV
jgi:ADP-ribose pyrophosphatase